MCEQGVRNLLESSDSGRALGWLEVTCGAVMEKAKTNFQNIKEEKGMKVT